MESADTTSTSAANADPRERFAGLIERHRGIVFKVAASYARSREDREDVAQDIAAHLWRAFPSFDGQRAFTTWMYRIALNVAISHVRARTLRGRHAAPMDEGLEEVPDDHAADPALDQQVRALHRFVHAQAPLDRALLLLYLEQHAYREIAEILGISETNVATKIHRLKQRICNEI